MVGLGGECDTALCAQAGTILRTRRCERKREPHGVNDGLFEVDGLIHDVPDFVGFGGGLRRAAGECEQFGQVDLDLAGDRLKTPRSLAFGRCADRSGHQHTF